MNPDNLVSLLAHACTTFAERKLFGTRVDGQFHWTTYQAFARQVDDFRAGLAVIGVKQGDRVACLCNNRVEWAVSAFASYGLGAAFVPIPPSQHPSEIHHIIADSESSILISSIPLVAQEALASCVAGQRPKLIVFEQPAAADALSFTDVIKLGQLHPAPPIIPRASMLAVILYTSGTTGLPKGVLLSHQNITSNINALNTHFPLSPDDRSLAVLPWSHAFGQTCELLGMLSSGGSIGISSIQTLSRSFSEVRPTILFGVPKLFSQLRQILLGRIQRASPLTQRLFHLATKTQTSAPDASHTGRRQRQLKRLSDRLVFSHLRERLGGRLRVALSGGAALNAETAGFMQLLGVTVFEGYGLSETSPVCTTNAPMHHKPGSVGRPLPGVQVRLIPSALSSDDNVGELVVKGPNVSSGYLNLPDETREAFTSDGALRTGDLATIDADGFVYILGRINEHYKLENGRFVAPAPIEAAITANPHIAQCMIYGLNRPFNLALVVPDLDACAPTAPLNVEDGLLQDPDLNALLRREIASACRDFKPFERPGQLLILAKPFTVEDGLLTPKLTLKRHKICQRFNAQIIAAYQTRQG